MSSATIIYQNSSARVTVTFKDFNDLLFTPKTLFYRVTNANGKVIIANTQVTTGFTTSWAKLFYGTALSITDPKDDGRRFLVVYGTWDEQSVNNAPFAGQYEFPGGIKAILGS
jgi:hypothetical protein